MEGDDAFEDVDVGTADDGEQVNVGGGHAFEDEWERLVGVHVGEMDATKEGGEGLVAELAGDGVFQNGAGGKAQDALTFHDGLGPAGADGSLA